MKTLKFHISNDVSKEINVKLPAKALKILAECFGIQDGKMVYEFLQKNMIKDFADLYASFDEGKYDYENFILEILEERANRRTGTFFNRQYDDLFEDINELFDADCIAHYDLRGMKLPMSDSRP